MKSLSKKLFIFIIVFILCSTIFIGNNDNVIVKAIYSEVESIIFRPNANSLPNQLAGDYTKVDDITPDWSATIVYTVVTGSYQTELYEIPNHTLSGDDFINNVTIYIVWKAHNTDETFGKYAINASGTIKYGAVQTLISTAWTTYSYTFENNPTTTNPWTWDEINNLTIGVSLKANAPAGEAKCTQIYIVVNYTLVPSIPSNISGDIIGSNLNISWEKGFGADNTIIRTKQGDYPSSITDGTQIYNNTGTYYVTPVVYDYFYSLWSWNSTLNNYSSQVNWSYGGLRINCFDFETHENLTFDVIISNPDGTQIYTNTGCTNTHYIDISLCPQNDRIGVIISNSSGTNDIDDYETSIYYMSILSGQWYDLNTYLVNSSRSDFYYIVVNDPKGNPIQDAKVLVRSYMNETDSFENISIQYTGGNGEINVPLIAGDLYKIVISASGYITGIFDFVPSTNDYIKTIILLYTNETYPTGKIEPLIVSFLGIVNRTIHNIILYYEDLLEQTLNAQVYVYVYNYTTETKSLVSSHTYTSTNDFNLEISNIDNESRYTINLFYNHTTFGFIKRTLVFEREIITLTTETETNALFNLNYGTNPFGWSNTFVWVFVVMIMFTGGQQESGFYMIVLGIILLLINFRIGFNVSLSSVAGGTIPMLCIIVGIGILWRDHEKIRG